MIHLLMYSNINSNIIKIFFFFFFFFFLISFSIICKYIYIYIYLIINNKGQPENVIITGNFDNWEKKIQMDKDPLTNIFISRILLPINQKIIYKFVVDGIWQNDPMLPEEIDMQGNKNNVLIIKPNNTNNSFKQINDFNKKDTDNIQLKMIPNTINTKKLNSKFQAKQELKHTKYDFIETRIENNINNNLFKGTFYFLFYLLLFFNEFIYLYIIYKYTIIYIKIIIYNIL